MEKANKTTWADLKKIVNELPESQLEKEITWWGDEKGGKLESVMILEEDYVLTDEGCEPASGIMTEIKASELKTYEYGAMSSKFSLQAENKLTAYATMCLHYNQSAHMVAIYSPESSKEDSWLTLDGKISERLDEIFGGKDSFDQYLENNADHIRACYTSIKRLV